MIVHVCAAQKNSLTLLSKAKPNPYFLSISLGKGILIVNQNSDVPMSESITNRYSLTKPNKNPPFAGAGVGTHLTLYEKNALDLSVSGYIFDMGNYEGKVLPAYNVAPDFDTLNYQVQASSRALLGELRFFLESYPYKPYIYMAAGVAKNELKNYVEATTNFCDTAAPMLYPFRDNKKTSFSYGLGLGIKRDFIPLNMGVSVEYRFFSLGDAQLGTTPIQSTNQRMRLNYFNMNTLVLSMYIN